MSKSDLPQVGDVIVSEAFVYGRYGYDRDRSGPVTIDSYRQEHYIVGFTVDEEERVRIAAETGQVPSKDQIVDIASYDTSRAKAEFVVVEAGVRGGGQIGFNDYHPGAWHITARRLKDDGTYDPDGELIKFYYASGGFDCCVPPEEILVVRKMKMMFV